MSGTEDVRQNPNRRQQELSLIRGGRLLAMAFLETPVQFSLSKYSITRLPCCRNLSKNVAGNKRLLIRTNIKHLNKSNQKAVLAEFWLWLDLLTTPSTWRFAILSREVFLLLTKAWCQSNVRALVFELWIVCASLLVWYKKRSNDFLWLFYLHSSVSLTSKVAMIILYGKDSKWFWLVVRSMPLSII